MVDKTHKHTPGHLGVVMKLLPPEKDIFTDASCHGFGNIMENRQMSGVWTAKYKVKHINVRELEVVRRALLTFAEDVENRVITVHSDNRPTVSCLKRQGCLKSRTLNKLTAQ